MAVVPLGESGRSVEGLVMSTTEPGGADLSRASLRAIAAFAARNALRVHPIAVYHYPESARAIDGLVATVRATAEGEPFDLRAAAADQEAVRSLARALKDINAISAADCLSEAASCAASCLNLARDEAITRALRSGDAALACADFSTRGLPPEVREGAASEIRKDLAVAASLEPPPDDEAGPPADPSDDGPFGPLWPSGPPGWFRPTPRPARNR